MSWILFCVFLFVPYFVPFSRNTTSFCFKGSALPSILRPCSITMNALFFLFSHASPLRPRRVLSKRLPLLSMWPSGCSAFLSYPLPGICSSLFISSFCLRMTYMITVETSLQRHPTCALPTSGEAWISPSEPLTIDPWTRGCFGFPLLREHITVQVIVYTLILLP